VKTPATSTSSPARVLWSAGKPEADGKPTAGFGKQADTSGEAKPRTPGFFVPEASR
jgi:hypothetical protein